MNSSTRFLSRLGASLLIAALPMASQASAAAQDAAVAVADLDAVPQVEAGGIAPCKGVHHSVRDAMRTMSLCITADNPPLECGRMDMDVQRFGNDEKRLPKARHSQEYWEGKLRNDGHAGTWRLVYLVTMGSSKNKVEARYFTDDHYATFCSL